MFRQLRRPLFAHSFFTIYPLRWPGREFCFPDPLAQFVQFAQLSHEVGCCVGDDCKARIGDNCKVAMKRAHLTPTKLKWTLQSTAYSTRVSQSAEYTSEHTVAAG
jgi:hypothetical protein